MDSQIININSVFYFMQSNINNINYINNIIMSNNIFVIKNDTGIVAFYADLEKAKNELKNIYKITSDFKNYDYEIIVYDLIDNEYKITNISYTYSFDNFLINTNTK
jgi:hypothetical protein